MKNVKLFDTFIKVNEAMNKPNTMAKDVFRDATDALTKTMGGRKLDKKYVKDYLKSIEQMARKNPGQLVKDYGDFDINDWIEDVQYNLQNEGKLNEKVSEKEVFAYLRDLRDSGKTNMFGAGEYLEKAFNLDKRTARELLTKWMKSF